MGNIEWFAANSSEVSQSPSLPSPPFFSLSVTATLLAGEFLIGKIGINLASSQGPGSLFFSAVGSVFLV